MSEMVRFFNGYEQSGTIKIYIHFNYFNIQKYIIIIFSGGWYTVSHPRVIRGDCGRDGCAACVVWGDKGKADQYVTPKIAAHTAGDQRTERGPFRTRTCGCALEVTRGNRGLKRCDGCTTPALAQPRSHCQVVASKSTEAERWAICAEGHRCSAIRQWASCNVQQEKRIRCRGRGL